MDKSDILTIYKISLVISNAERQERNQNEEGEAEGRAIYPDLTR